VTRVVGAANQTELAKAAIRLALLVDLDFPSGHVRLHDGGGPLTFGGNTYQGIGELGSIEPVFEEAATIARPLDMAISGVDPAKISIAMTEVYQGRSAALYLGLLDETTSVFVADPEVVWEGRMDTMTIEGSGPACVIRMHCEHRLQREPRIARYTDEDQQQAYSGDVFFNFVPYIRGFRSQWADGISQFGLGSSFSRAVRNLFPRGP
jgi:hypothetical protein